MLRGEILVEWERRCGVEIMQHQAIRTVRHHADQFPSSGENQITAGGVELPKETFEETAIQFQVFRGAQIDLKAAFPIIPLTGADQDRVLKFVW